MKKWQIRSNRPNSEGRLSVYIPEKEKWEVQQSYDHGTFAMEQKEAHLLARELQKDARKSWVRLYEMIG
jgi:hypothetical protein